MKRVYDESEKKNVPPAEPIEPKEDIDAIIKMKIQDEPDWRKRASLAALRISNSLEE